MTSSSRRDRWFRLAIATLASLTISIGAQCACIEQPFAGERLRIVSEQMWVQGMSLTIVELPALDKATVRERFDDFWRKDHRETRTATSSGIEVTSAMKGGCLYSLQLPTDSSSGMPTRLVVTDLHRAAPTLPSAFEWPPAAEAEILTDAVSEDGRRLNRLLAYRVQVNAGTAAAQCIKRLARADWKIAGVTVLNDQQVTFSGRRGTTSLDAVVARDGSGAVVTMNFTEQDG